MHAKTVAGRGISDFCVLALALVLASCGGGGGGGDNAPAYGGYVKASNTGAGDQFGASIALSGDGNTLAVGAWLEDSSTTGTDSTPNELAAEAGAVYVFTRSAGTWSQQAYVKASNTGAGDFFGFSVALSGDGNTLAVGAPGKASGDGAAYVFTRSAGTWSQQTYVKASNTGVHDLFGYSVALSGEGNTLAVGADGELFGFGAVYVFTRSANTWSQQARVIPQEAPGGGGFGDAVALSGDGNTLAVGTSSDSDGVIADAGAVYVFTRSAGTWSEEARVKASNPGVSDRFGNSVALSGDGNTLAAGAWQEDSSTPGINSTPDELAPAAGAAYVFTRSAGTWSQQAYVKASNTGVTDFFGWSVALSGDGNTLAVGAIGEDGSSTGVGSAPNELAPDAGAVFVYTRVAGTWSQQAYVKASNTGVGDVFGSSVALSGDGNTLAVGAIGEASSSTGIGSTPNELAPAAGAVYVY